MKVRACAAAAVAIGSLSVPATAADVGSPGPYYSAPVYAPATIQTYSWMGPYLGFNAGYQWGSVTRNPTNPEGFSGGIQGGYNFQTGQMVLGGETDIQLSTAEDTFAAWKFANPWFGTVRGRAGLALNNVMFYGTGGFAYGGGRAHVAGASDSRTHLGWTAGLGIEVGLTPNWSAKAEYLYVRLEDRGYVLTGVNNGFQSNVFRLGVNYRF